MYSEREIIEGCIKKNSAAQKHLYDTYKGKLFASSLRYISNREDAKDVLHDAFIKIFNSIDKFKGNSTLETWMRRIVANTAIDFLKKKQKLVLQYSESYESFSDSDKAKEEEMIEEGLYTKEQILAGVETLSYDLKLVLNLYYQEDYTHQEIAELLQIKEETSRTRLHRAKIALKNALKRYNQYPIVN